jgi:hypothetical protein
MVSSDFFVIHYQEVDDPTEIVLASVVPLLLQLLPLAMYGKLSALEIFQRLSSWSIDIEMASNVALPSLRVQVELLWYL